MYMTCFSFQRWSRDLRTNIDQFEHRCCQEFENNRLFALNWGS